MADETKAKNLTNAATPRKRFVGSKTLVPSKPGASHSTNQVPLDILNDAGVNESVKVLPSNYSFEIHKTIHHVRKNNAKLVALQMPEGLQMFACAIADIIERYTQALTVIMGDVTYGACCVDDYSAVALGCDMLIHYGHSCLVPIVQTSIRTLYVFVEIAIDSVHLAQSIRLNFPNTRQLFYEALLQSDELDSQIPLGQKIGPASQTLRIEESSKSNAEGAAGASQEPTRLALVSTIQFVSALHRLKEDITVEDKEDQMTPVTGTAVPLHRFWRGKYEAIIPRSKPLSPGEILGCTAPRLKDVDGIVYVGDGRFHLEAIMIANPTVPAFRYDPYSKTLTRERYAYREMHTMRDEAVQSARQSIFALSNHSPSPPSWGVILGTLGRQGNLNQFNGIVQQLTQHSTPGPIPHVPILLSELSPAKLALFEPHITTFVQTSCPRLSIDWGYAFGKPLLSPYECAVALGQVKGWMGEQDRGGKTIKNHDAPVYPMDFYEAGSLWALSRTKTKS